MFIEQGRGFPNSRFNSWCVNDGGLFWKQGGDHAHARFANGKYLLTANKCTQILYKLNPYEEQMK